MILYDLKCRQGHGFEGWFRDSAAFEAQSRSGGLACPFCGSAEVEKAPMAPAIRRGRDKGASVEEAKAKAVRQALLEVRRRVEESHDYVGPRFAEEARRIHYGETEARGIYGETSPQEAKDLREEGVAVAAIPWLEREDC